MKDQPLPNWRDRQKLLYSKDKNIDPKILIQFGELALSLGCLQDALDYFKAAKDSKALEKLVSVAIKDGDAFLIQAIEKITGPLTVENWNKVGYNAFELGKHRFAQTAFEKTQNELMLAKVRAASST